MDTDIKQIKSKQRVSDHGEVFTSEREVNAMLDLVKQETERIDSRFLEPACGNGNFLVEILRRKLEIVENRYIKSQLEFERYAIIAISSIYGVEILFDNVLACRNRLYDIFNENYSRHFKTNCKDDCRKSVHYILSRNILWGNALNLKTPDKNSKHIIFTEWSPVNGSMIKRRDFTFHSLMEHGLQRETPLFSDLGEDVFIPEPIKDYPLVHFLEIGKLIDAD